MVVLGPFPHEDHLEVLQESKVEVRPIVDLRTAFDQLKPKCIIVVVESAPVDVCRNRHCRVVWPLSVGYSGMMELLVYQKAGSAW